MDVEIQGNYYPSHMVSNHKGLLFSIITEFTQNGRIVNKGNWIEE